MTTVAKQLTSNIHNEAEAIAMAMDNGDEASAMELLRSLRRMSMAQAARDALLRDPFAAAEDDFDEALLGRQR